MQNVKSKQRKNVSYVIWTYWPYPGRYPMGVGNYTSQKVKPIEHLQKQVFIGKVGKNPTCIGRTKGNTIRRGREYHLKPENL